MIFLHVSCIVQDYEKRSNIGNKYGMIKKKRRFKYINKVLSASVSFKPVCRLFVDSLKSTLWWI